MCTHRERIRKTLRGERTDRIPRGEFFIADEFVRAFLRMPTAGDDALSRCLESIAPWRSMRDDASEATFRQQRAVVEQLGLDIAPVAFSAGWGAPAQPDEDRALDFLTRWRAESERFVFALIDGPFSAAVKARSFAGLMHYVRGAPHLARDLFARGADETRVLARALRDAGADGVILGEDIAFGKTTYLAPNDLRDLYFPALRELAREVRALGLVVFLHSDGNLNAILDDLAACELDGLQGLEPESGMRIGAVRARVGDALTLWGNLSFDFLSAPRTDAEIESALTSLPTPATGVGGEVGKFIFGSSGGLVQGMHIETVQRIYRALDLPGFGNLEGLRSH